MSLVSATQVLDGAEAGSVNPYQLSPSSPETPPPPTHRVVLNITFEPDPSPNSTVWAHFNNISMALPADGGPSAPSLLEQLLTNGIPPNEDFGAHVITVPEAGVVELVINNFDQGEVGSWTPVLRNPRPWLCIVED